MSNPFIVNGLRKLEKQSAGINKDDSDPLDRRGGVRLAGATQRRMREIVE